MTGRQLRGQLDRLDKGFPAVNMIFFFFARMFFEWDIWTFKMGLNGTFPPKWDILFKMGHLAYLIIRELKMKTSTLRIYFYTKQLTGVKFYI